MARLRFNARMWLIAGLPRIRVHAMVLLLVLLSKPTPPPMTWQYWRGAR